MPGCRVGLQRSAPTYGKRLAVLHDYALYKSTFTLLYFTIGVKGVQHWSVQALTGLAATPLALLPWQVVVAET